MSRIIGTCEKCGYRFDVLLSFSCPACRRLKVLETFRPINPLRTALGVMGLKEDAELDGVYHWHGEPYYHPEQHAEVPRGAKEAQIRELWRLNDSLRASEEDQRYDLKRLFRL